jgi:hypothetical protein
MSYLEKNRDWEFDSGELKHENTKYENTKKKFVFCIFRVFVFRVFVFHLLTLHCGKTFCSIRTPASVTLVLLKFKDRRFFNSDSSFKAASVT